MASTPQIASQVLPAANPKPSLADPDYRKLRARNASLTKWENERLRRQLESMHGSAAVLLNRLESKDAALLAKWPKVLDIINHHAIEKKQPWAIKMFKEIKDDFVKRATQELDSKRNSKQASVSVTIENALINMPVKAESSQPIESITVTSLQAVSPDLAQTPAESESIPST